MDASSRKILVLFKEEIEVAAVVGTLDSQLWDYLAQLGREWTLDTQEVEGTNNRIKTMVKQAPFMSWELLSDRLTYSKTVVGKSSEEKHELANLCESFHSEAKSLLGPADNRTRYAALIADRFAQGQSGTNAECEAQCDDNAGCEATAATEKQETPRRTHPT